MYTRLFSRSLCSYYDSYLCSLSYYALKFDVILFNFPLLWKISCRNSDSNKHRIDIILHFSWSYSCILYNLWYHTVISNIIKAREEKSYKNPLNPWTIYDKCVHVFIPLKENSQARKMSGNAFGWWARGTRVRSPILD